MGGAARLLGGAAFIALATRNLHGPVSLHEAALLGGALAAATGFGLVIGLLAGLIAVLAGDPALAAHLQLAAADPTDILYVSAVGATLAGVGYATDLARRRSRLGRALPEAARPARSPPAPRARLARLATAVQSSTRLEVRRIAAGLALALAGGGLALASHKLLSPVGIIALAVGPALLAAEWTNAVCGGAVVGLAAALSTWLFAGAGVAEHASWALGVVLASTLGWRLGALAENARRERGVKADFARATSKLADCDEALIGPVLRESLQRIDRKAAIEIRKPCGALAYPQAHKSAAAASAAWRGRRLFVDGHDAGEIRWLLSGAAGDGGAATEATAALIDVAALAIVKARLAAEKADMESSIRAEQLRTILLDAVSHHFRSPLAGILGSATSLLSLQQPHDRCVERQFLLIIKEQANRLSRYVDNFLSLARLEAGAIEINPSEINVEALIYDVWDSFGASGGARRYLDVDLEIDAIRSDAGLLTQIFGNLLENAIKYSPEESVVAVRGRRQGDELLIEIVDQGCGAPEGALERMFERFHRVHSGKSPGMGLGLYISRSLVVMLGGRISARNRQDGRTGLEMSIALPFSGTIS